jgi:SAM-dependent methyltransferase
VIEWPAGHAGSAVPGRCRVCSSERLETVHALPGPAGARIDACRSCGVLVRVPGPDSGAPMPGRSRYDETLANARAGARAYHRAMALSRLDFVAARRTPEAPAPAGRRRRVVGPGTGEFLCVAAERGFAAEGLEPSPAMAGCAREASGCIVHETPLPAFRPQAPYAMIALWHVFEHLPDPLDVLDRLAGWLEPGGCLGIIVPNAQGWVDRLLGRWGPSVNQEDHLFHYAPGSLARLVGTRLDVEEVRTHEPPENVLTSVYAAMAIAARAAARPAATGRATAWPAAAWRERAPFVVAGILRPVTWPLRVIAEAAGGGHEVWLRARRP